MIFEYAISFIIAFLVSFSSTPIARKLAFKFGAIDVPKDSRRMHKKPIARLGGLAIVAGFFISILFSLFGSFLDLPGLIFNRYILGLLIGSLIIVALGIIDDIKPLDAKIKLGIQLLAVITVVLVSDVRIVAVTNPFAVAGVSKLSEYLSLPITVLWILGITNAINLIDGLDGLAAGVASISYLTLFLVSVIVGDCGTAVLTAMFAGATLGFLPYNFNPAKIFMGDTGSMFLGFTLAIISVQGTLKSYAAISIAIPLLTLGLPLFDTASAILRRVITRKPIMQADRSHLHHKLIDMGLSHRQSVILMYTTSAALGLCAVVLADRGAISAIVLVLAISGFIIAGGKYMNEYGESEKLKNKTDSEDELKNKTDSEDDTKCNIENNNIK